MVIDYCSLKQHKRDLQRLARTCVACKLGDHANCTKVKEPTRRYVWVECQCNHVKLVPRTPAAQDDEPFVHQDDASVASRFVDRD